MIGFVSLRTGEHVLVHGIETRAVPDELTDVKYSFNIQVFVLNAGPPVYGVSDRESAAAVEHRLIRPRHRGAPDRLVP